MSFYPVSLDLNGRFCIVVGGGRVAERKVRTLLASGARVQVISPELTSGLAELYRQGQLTWVGRQYQEGDLAGAFLVIAATDNAEVQRRSFAEAEGSHLLINVADVPQRCNFILPAIVRQGDLTISISTGGKSPALAKQLRMELEKYFGPEYKILVDMLGILRRQVLAAGQAQAENEAIFNRLLHEKLPVWIREGKWEEVENHVRSVLGDTFDVTVLHELAASGAAR